MRKEKCLADEVPVGISPFFLQLILLPGINVSHQLHRWAVQGNM